MRWFWPDWSGDWRLETLSEKSCTLTVVDPTPGEVEKLSGFLKKARSKNWISQLDGVSLHGESKVVLDAPVATVGRLLLEKRPKGILTALKSTRGKIEAVIDDPKKAEEKAGAAAAATSVRRPTLCCPVPVPGPDVRASEVLQEFCSPRQWADWKNEGWLRCYGNLSGRLYEIAHRHHPRAIRRGKIVWDVEGAHVMHCHDVSLPPPEEVLVMKLVLEHAEHWIRNQSGALDALYPEPIYDNPFMTADEQLSDGTADAGLTVGLGFWAMVLTAVGRDMEKGPTP